MSDLQLTVYIFGAVFFWCAGVLLAVGQPPVDKTQVVVAGWVSALLGIFWPVIVVALLVGLASLAVALVARTLIYTKGR